ncbi:Regulator of RpoS [Streptomyces alboniger]
MYGQVSQPHPAMGQNEPVPSLLLIEDDDAIRTALELSLTRQGHRVATAATGEDGLKLLREQRPDLIVLDVMLPGIDGFEVCRRIRRTDQLPIILLTARSDDIDVVVGLESGADDYVVKPVQGRVLDARIRAVLRRGEREANDAASFGSLFIDRAPITVTKNGEDRPAHPDRLPSAARTEPAAGPGAVPAAVAAAGVGTRLSGRLTAGGRLCAAAAGQGRGRAVVADADPYGPWCRLPAGHS